MTRRTKELASDLKTFGVATVDVEPAADYVGERRAKARAYSAMRAAARHVGHKVKITLVQRDDEGGGPYVLGYVAYEPEHD